MHRKTGGKQLIDRRCLRRAAGRGQCDLRGTRIGVVGQGKRHRIAYGHTHAVAAGNRVGECGRQRGDAKGIRQHNCRCRLQARTAACQRSDERHRITRENRVVVLIANLHAQIAEGLMDGRGGWITADNRNGSRRVGQVGQCERRLWTQAAAMRTDAIAACAGIGSRRADECAVVVGVATGRAKRGRCAGNGRGKRYALAGNSAAKHIKHTRAQWLCKYRVDHRALAAAGNSDDLCRRVVAATRAADRCCR